MWELYVTDFTLFEKAEWIQRWSVDRLTKNRVTDASRGGNITLGEKAHRTSMYP